MKAVRAAFVILVTCFFGLPSAFAGMDRPVRAALWLAAITLSGFAIALWFPMLFVTVGIGVVALIDAMLCAARSKGPVVLLARTPGLFFVLTFGMAFLVWTFAVQAHAAIMGDMAPTLEDGDHLVIDKLHHGSPAPGDLIAFPHPHYPDFLVAKRVIALAGETIEVRCDMVYVNGKRLPSTLDDVHATYEEERFRDGTWERTWETKAASRYHEWIGEHDYDVLHDAERPERDRRITAGTQSSGAPDDFPPLVGPLPWSCIEDKDGAPLARALCTLVDGPPVSDPCAPHRHYVVPAGHVFVLGDNRGRSRWDDSRFWGALPISSIKGRVTGVWYSKGPDGIRWSRIGEVE